MTVEIESAWQRHPDYRIDIEPCRPIGQVWHDDVLLAVSDECLVVQESKRKARVYFPEKDVRWEFFEPTEHRTICPFKRQADYWRLAGTETPDENVAWADAHAPLSKEVMTATVDFHDMVDVTEWLLYNNSAIWAWRGLTQGEGRVFTRDGRMVASYSVQAMIRPLAKESTTL